MLMTSPDAKNEQSPSKAPAKFPLFINILTIFLLVVLPVAGGLTYYNYNAGAQRTLLSAKRMMSDIVSDVVRQGLNMVGTAWNLAQLTGGNPLLGAPPSAGRHPLRGYFLTALHSYPHLYSIYIGYDSGEYYQAVKVSQMTQAARKKIGAPPRAAYGIRNITTDAQGRRMTVWSFLDKQRRVIKVSPPRPAGFDPRIRPWFKMSVQPGAVDMTDFYIFYDIRQPGLTVAQRFAFGAGGVLGVDLTARTLCEFVARQKVTKSGITFVFDEDGRLIAYPQVEKLTVVTQEGGRRVMRLAKLEQAGNPVVTQAARRFHPGLERQRLDFTVAGHDYVGGVIKVATPGGDIIYVAVLAQLDELLAPVIASNLTSLLISILVIAIAIPLIAFTAWRLSKPLRRVARETDGIKEFKLEPTPPIKSRISEVHRLTESVATMKTTLRTFAQYVPKDLVKQLVETGREQKLGGEKRELSVMFSDVAGFTDMAESMDPEALMLKTSAYFEKLCQVILAHGGTIDKFIGDAIMAFWNPPLPDAEHQRHACLAMLACRRASLAMDQEWSAQDRPEMFTRFGLHCGETVVGNLGSADRMDYTALGATVNLASRLEGLNKYYGTQLLASQAVVEAVGAEFVFRPVDLVQPKGTSIPVGVFELVGTVEGEPETAATPAQAAYCAGWREAFELYLGRDWPGALARFQALAEQEPGDKLAGVYVQRVRAYGQNPPPPEWNGAEVFQVK